MITIFSTIVLLGILIFVHELGHFIIARLCKVKVEKFSFGFGPKLIGIKIGETEYRISLIPLGGYVKMLGENPDEAQETSPESLRNKKWWQKILIAFGGPFANFVFAIFILILTFMIGIKNYDLEPTIGRISYSDHEELRKFQTGDQILEIDGNDITSWLSIIKTWKNYDELHNVVIQRNNQTLNLNVKNFDYTYWLTDIKPFVSAKIGEVLYGLPAYQSGLKKEDIIIAINDSPISDWYDMQTIIRENPEKPLKFKIKRNNEIKNLQITPQINTESEDSQGIIGVSHKLDLVYFEKYSFINSVKYGFLTGISIVYRYYSGLFRLFKYPSYIGKSVGGPIMIAALSGQQAKEGLSTFLSFMAMISIILMIMNLLPIPILDGGMIIFAICEGIARKPLKKSVEALLQRVGLAIILTLMIFAFYNDISRFVNRQLSIIKGDVPSVLEKNE
ncbi:MAG: RIP metalloprotease RseP [Candidatus Cloacimonetes bacterium]|nr:RIP metalloprotease RseP [Candidatus Cloacimonadota bacterium]